MGLFENIFKPKGKTIVIPNSTFEMLTTYRPVFTSRNGGIYESELIRAAIHAKASHISKLKVELRGSAKPELKNKLKHAPNEFQTWGQFLYRVSTILDVNNNAFICPMYNRFGDMTGIFPVLPSRCEIKELNGVPYLSYEFSNGKRGAIELALCGVMTKHQYSNDFFGENNLALSPTLDLIDIQNQGITEGVKSAATYRFMARKSNFASPEDLAEERKAFSEANFSGDNGGLLLFPNTYEDIKQVDAKPFVIDAEQMSQIKASVFNYFGVNEKVLQGSAMGDDLDAFWNCEIEPFAIQLSEVITKMLYTLQERSYGNEVRFNANRLQYMSTSNKVAFAQMMADRGGLTIDEMRELFNYEPLPDGAGEMIPIRGEYYNVNETNEGGNDDA